MNDLISIIIPIFNNEKFLNEVLISIIDTNDEANYEIILVDDGSNDRSPKICDSYARKYANIHTFHKKNKGVSAARNFGIKKATGKWLWFIDGDDIPFEGAVDKLHIILKNNEADTYIFGYYIFEKKLTLDSNSSINVFNISKKKAVGTILEPKYAGYPWNKIFKKSIILSNNIKFPENMSMCEDLEFCYKAYEKSKSFKFIPCPLYGYRCTNNSISHNISNKHFKDQAIANYDFYEYIRKKFPTYTLMCLKNTIIAVVAYLHRYSSEDSQYETLARFLKQVQIRDVGLSKRYLIEIWSFRKCQLLFKAIGLIGKISRKLEHNI